MKIVIDIDEDMAQGIIDGENDAPRNIVRAFQATIADAIKNGTPIPKGHGRLIDENELIDEIVCEEIDGRYYDVIYAHSIYDANTIIEADKGESEDKE